MSMFHELMMRKKEQIMYATIKGTLTENNGVFSGFSSSNYLQLQNDIDYTKNYEIVIKFKTTSSVYHSVILGSNSTANSIKIETAYGTRFRIFLSSNGTSWNIANGVYGETNAMSLNNDYYLKFIYSAVNGYAIYLSSDKINWSLQWQTSSTSALNMSGYKLLLGLSLFDNNYLAGNIDLPNSYIKLGGTKYNLQAVVGYTIVGSPTITDGVVSGFSDSDYLKITDLSRAIPNGCVNFEINIDFNLTNIGTMQMLFSNTRTNNKVCGIWIEVGSNKKIVVRVGDGNNVQSLTSNTLSNGHYTLRFVADGNNYKLYLNDVIEVSDSITQILGYTTNKDVYIGKGYGFNNVYFLDTIDMNKTWIKTYGKLVFNGQEG